MRLSGHHADRGEDGRIAKGCPAPWRGASFFPRIVKKGDILQAISPRRWYNSSSKEVMAVTEEARVVTYDEELRIEAYRFSGVAQSFPSHFHEYYVLGLMEAGQRSLTCRDGV